MEVSGQIHASVVLPSGKETPVLIGQDAGWSQARSGRCGDEKDLLPLSESEPGPSIPQPGSIPTKISLLF
jgi:hypothetical protein